MASTWLTVLTFGKVIISPSGSGPASSRVDRNRSRVRSPRRRVGASKHLNRRPTKAGATPSATAAASSRADPDGVGVLVVVAAVAVAVLEVEPQVLDRLGAELGRDLRGHLGREVVGQPELGAEPVEPAVLGHQGRGLARPSARGSPRS